MPIRPKPVVESLEPRRLLSATLLTTETANLMGPGTSDGEVAYFSHRASEYATSEIWRSDGTSGGTYALGTVPHPVKADPREMTLLGDKLLFAGNHIDSYGQELYAIDTAGGTAQVLGNLAPDGDYHGVHSLHKVGDVVYLLGGDDGGLHDVYVTDGTVAGTRLMDELPGVGNGGIVALGAPGDGTIYYARRDLATNVTRVYRSDGTTSGTTQLAEILGRPHVGGFVQAGEHVVFNVNTYPGSLWSTDGTAAGTREIASTGGTAFVSAGSFALYREWETAGDNEGYVWRTDGTSEGTSRVGTLDLADVPITYFVAVGGAGYLPTPNGLWRITEDGHEKIYDGAAYVPRVVGDRIFFSASYDVRGMSPIQNAVAVTDGTRAGTELLDDPDPTVGGGVGYFLPISGGVVFGIRDSGLYQIGADAPPLPSVSGYLYRDHDVDGVRDAGEGREEHAGVAPKIPYYLPVDADGRFEISWVLPGAVTLETRIFRSFVRNSTPATRSVTVTYGDEITDLNFGFERFNLAKGQVVIDADFDDAPDYGEPAAPGHTVYADIDGDGYLGAGEPATISGEDGNWVLEDLPNGPIALRVEPAAGWHVSAPIRRSHVFVGSPDGVEVRNIRFGVTQEVPASYVGFEGFDDLDRDGTRDPNEPAEPSGFGLHAKEAALAWIDFNRNGLLDEEESFVRLGPTALIKLPEPGDYRVEFLPPTGWEITTPALELSIAPGERIFDIPVGMAIPATSGTTVRGVVRHDFNGDGNLADDPPLADASVYIDLDNDFARDPDEPHLWTDALGRFAFVNLPAGDIVLRTGSTLDGSGFQWVQTVPGPGEPIAVTLQAGQIVDDLMFGLSRATPESYGTISGETWWDADVDAIRDSSETAPTDLVAVYVDRDNDGILDSGEPRTWSDVGGRFVLENLLPGYHRLRIMSAHPTARVVGSLTHNLEEGIVVHVPTGETSHVGEIGVFKLPSQPVSAVLDYDQLPLALNVEFDVLSDPEAIAAAAIFTDGSDRTFTPDRYRFPDSNTIRFEFDQPVPDGNHLLTLSPESLAGASVLPLPEVFHHDFFVLAGDASRDRKVDFSDFLILRSNFGRTDDPLFSEADFNYDGKVDFGDFLILRSRFGVNLPPPSSGSLFGDGEDDSER